MVARKLSLWQNKPETQCITCTYSGHIPALLLEKYVAPDIQMPSLLGHPYHKRWCVRSVSHRVSSDTDFVTLGRLSFFCYRMRQFKVYKTSRQLRKQIKMETSPQESLQERKKHRKQELCWNSRSSQSQGLTRIHWAQPHVTQTEIINRRKTLLGLQKLYLVWIFSLCAQINIFQGFASESKLKWSPGLG